jgi:CheY-like chemotaxis protein
VDDNAVNREIVCQQLTEWRVDVQTASDGPTALTMMRQAIAEARPFDVAILDWHMPNMNGIDLARAMRASDEFQQTRLIMLTSVDDKIQADELKGLGFCAYLVKPVRRGKLLNALAEIIGSDDQDAAPEADDLPAPPSEDSTQIAEVFTHVLVAEDNDVNQLVAAEILKNAGYTCDIVDNGTAAVAAVASKHYDLVLMDCQMPELDGFEASKAIRAREAELAAQPCGGAVHIPIVALTANAIKGDREVCFAAGMDEYITKPINPAKLIEVIEALLPPGARASAKAARRSAQIAAAVPLDVPSLLDRCMGNVEFLKRLLDKFRNRIGEDVERLSQAVEAQNAQETARLAHSLKGSAANVSAITLSHLALELEQLGVAGDLTPAEACLAKIREEVDRCIEYVPVVSSPAAPDAAPKPPKAENQDEMDPQTKEAESGGN